MCYLLSSVLIIYISDLFSARMPASVLFIVTSHDQLGNTGNKTGWYLPEVAHPYHVLKKAGHNIAFVSPKGGKAPMVY